MRGKELPLSSQQHPQNCLTLNLRETLGCPRARCRRSELCRTLASAIKHSLQNCVPGQIQVRTGKARDAMGMVSSCPTSHDPLHAAALRSHGARIPLLRAHSRHIQLAYITCTVAACTQGTRVDSRPSSSTCTVDHGPGSWTVAGPRATVPLRRPVCAWARMPGRGAQ